MGQSAEEWGERLVGCARRNDLKGLRALLGEDAATGEEPREKAGARALLEAALKGHPRCVELLVAHGFGIDARDQYGRGALSLSREEGEAGREARVRELVAAAATPATPRPEPYRVRIVSAARGRAGSERTARSRLDAELAESGELAVRVLWRTNDPAVGTVWLLAEEASVFREVGEAARARGVDFELRPLLPDVRGTAVQAGLFAAS